MISTSHLLIDTFVTSKIALNTTLMSEAISYEDKESHFDLIDKLEDSYSFSALKNAICTYLILSEIDLNENIILQELHCESKLVDVFKLSYWYLLQKYPLEHYPELWF